MIRTAGCCLHSPHLLQLSQPSGPALRYQNKLLSWGNTRNCCYRRAGTMSNPVKHTLQQSDILIFLLGSYPEMSHFTFFSFSPFKQVQQFCCIVFPLCPRLWQMLQEGPCTSHTRQTLLTKNPSHIPEWKKSGKINKENKCKIIIIFIKYI